jgi:3-oxoacyl-[acyl-carrier protein] reductase
MRKTALITGATGGIGSAIVNVLSEEHDLVIVGRNQEKLNIISKSNKAILKTFSCDLSKQEDVKKLIEKMSSESIEIDILVNNAGITDDSLFIRMTLDKWQKVIETNLTANFNLTNFIAKQMIKKRWGRIINITSVVGHTGNLGQANYCASKLGVVGMSKSIALELAKRNITVNCISPGFIETNMTASLSQDQKDNILKKIPLEKIGSPEDIAYSVRFLASNESGYITGETIHVNGGLAML